MLLLATTAQYLKGSLLLRGANPLHRLSRSTSPSPKISRVSLQRTTSSPHRRPSGRSRTTLFLTATANHILSRLFTLVATSHDACSSSLSGISSAVYVMTHVAWYSKLLTSFLELPRISPLPVRSRNSRSSTAIASQHLHCCHWMR